MEEVYLKKSYATVGFNNSLNSVCIINHGPQTSSEFRNTIKNGVACFKNHQNSRIPLNWYADTRKLGAISLDDIEWCAGFIKRECRHLAKIALLMPETIFGHSAIEIFSIRFKKRGVSNKLFLSPDKAITWLNEQ